MVGFFTPLHDPSHRLTNEATESVRRRNASDIRQHIINETPFVCFLARTFLSFPKCTFSDSLKSQHNSRLCLNLESFVPSPFPCLKPEALLPCLH